VTTTLVAPLACCGVVAVIEVALTTVLPTVTPPMVSVAPVTKFVPVTVTLVPPRLAPVAGETFESVGAGRGVYVNALAAMPLCVSGFETAIATAPVEAAAGVVAVMLVALATVMPVAATPPTVTVAPLTKPVPVIVMLVPPPTLPEVGEALVTVGAAAAV